MELGSEAIFLAGNMFSGVETWNPLACRCSHECTYCSTNSLRKRYKACKIKYEGEPRLVGHEFKNLGKGKRIFVCSQNDLFAANVPDELIISIIEHTLKYPDNIYMFQTKNPARLVDFIEYYPLQSMLGTTIETNREELIEEYSDAPSVNERVTAMSWLFGAFERYVVIEPVMDFDLDILELMVWKCRPKLVYIGADSKKSNLPEPSADKIIRLMEGIKARTELEIKPNLKRLLGDK